ncbi:MAG: multi-sensor hybrid histidine kinase [Rickettsiaceae bacterium]|jgi:signal transduction histidine kinase|nr:multi-sensor hybrid histidine kinase [Rickettsiaceae bacterium]
MLKNLALLPKVSHDLRNYISGISGLAHFIAEGLENYQEKIAQIGVKEIDPATTKDLEEAIEFSKMLTPHAMEMLHYVEDLLDETQVENGNFTLGKATRCNIGETIKRMLIFNKHFLIDQRVTVVADIASDVPQLEIDVRRFKQVLTNLLTNAVKYSPEDNEVKIIVKYSRPDNENSKPSNKERYGKISIAFIDSGIGMSEEEIEMALNGDGHKIDKSALNKEINSHGIGMPIVKQLIEIMGGEMRIESKKGEGTRVELDFCSI